MVKASKKLKIGLALGSGAARGLAHIGVLKVLQRNNIPIDFISGASIGAVVGALYSATKNIAQLEDIITSADWRTYLSLIDPVAANGFIRGGKIRKFLARYLGNSTFNDLHIPLLIAATDFQTGEAVVLDKGDLLEAIMASSAIPLVFQPAKIEGRVLIDGGFSSPMPIDPLRKKGAGKIIAVNLDADYFSRKKDKFSAGETALQAINLLRYHLAARDAVKADVVVAPEVGEIMSYSFLAGKRVIDAGEKAAQKVLPEIKKIIG